MTMQRIESRQNKALRHLARLGREKKYRRECGEMLCEGDKMLEEALRSGARPTSVLVRDSAAESSSLCALLERAKAAGAALYQAAEPLFAQACTVETPQNILCACPAPALGKILPENAERVLLLEGVQDPGNLGTILRTAEAFALDAVILCEGCAEAFAPKVVRATMGAIFRLPLFSLPLEQAVSQTKSLGLPVYAAALTADSRPAESVPLCRSAVIIGSEGQGVTERALALADGHVIIPMPGRAESLNASVAAAILMYRMTLRE